MNGYETHPAGTIGVVTTSGFIGAAIRLLTRSQVNHAFICLGDGRIVEAQAKGAVISVGEYDQRRAMYRMPAQGMGPAIAAEALKLVGRPYGFLDILALALMQFRIKLPFIRKRIQREDRLICSQLVDLAYRNAGIQLFNDNRLPQDVTPGDLLWPMFSPGWDGTWVPS